MTRRQRGAALPETALVLTLVLLVLVGAVRIANIGYEQVSLDGAAFFHAHQTGLKQTYPDAAASLDPEAAAHAAFPRAGGATLDAQTYAPPDAQVGTNYNVAATDNRRGGASLIQPLQTISHATHTGLDSLSIFDAGQLNVVGVGVDASFQETGVHGNIAGADLTSSASFTGGTDYFSQGENTPPYFGGFHYMRICPTPATATTQTDPLPVSTWNTCGAKPEFLALGLAEYLDEDNWSRNPIGVAPTGPSGAVFWETLYHQNVYAQLSSDLPADIGSRAALMAAQAALAHAAGGGKPIDKVYDWDSAQQGGFPDTNYVPGQYPLTPGAGYP